MKTIKTFEEFVNEQLGNTSESDKFLREGKSTYSLKNFVDELNTWSQFTDSEISKADKSNINVKNNAKLKKLVNDWSRGIYDEDIEILTQEVRFMINKL